MSYMALIGAMAPYRPTDTNVVQRATTLLFMSTSEQHLVRRGATSAQIAAIFGSVMAFIDGTVINAATAKLQIVFVTKNVSGIAKLYSGLGKRTFAICDKQDGDDEAKIRTEVELLLMHEEKGSENLVITGTTQTALMRFAKQIDWPPHILKTYPDPSAKVVDALAEYFARSKGTGGFADFLAQRNEGEMPA